jgi:hypothetical protein
MLVFFLYQCFICFAVAVGIFGVVAVLVVACLQPKWFDICAAKHGCWEMWQELWRYMLIVFGFGDIFLKRDG